MIEAINLSKRNGQTLGVDDLTFTVAAGQVTGFLGPNSSGKSTTMRMIVGLDAPTSGRVTVGGHPFRELRFPLHEVGALLDDSAVHPGRTARNHLRWLADSNRLARSRVDEVTGMVGLSAVAHRRRPVSPAPPGCRTGGSWPSTQMAPSCGRWASPCSATSPAPATTRPSRSAAARPSPCSLCSGSSSSCWSSDIDEPNGRWFETRTLTSFAIYSLLLGVVCLIRFA